MGTHVQSTARAWRFSHCLQSAPAPTGQDEVSWQTWWGRTPRGRAESHTIKQRVKPKVVTPLRSFWPEVVVSCNSLVLSTESLDFSSSIVSPLISSPARGRDHLFGGYTSKKYIYILSTNLITIIMRFWLSYWIWACSHALWFLFGKTAKHKQPANICHHRVNKRDAGAAGAVERRQLSPHDLRGPSELYLKLPSEYEVHTRAENHANDCCCQQRAFWKTYILLGAVCFLCRSSGHQAVYKHVTSAWLNIEQRRDNLPV